MDRQYDEEHDADLLNTIGNELLDKVSIDVGKLYNMAENFQHPEIKKNIQDMLEQIMAQIVDIGEDFVQVEIEDFME